MKKYEAYKDSGIKWIGMIPEGWEVKSLLHVLRSKITDGPHETPRLVDEGIPFISVDSLNDSENIDFSIVKKFISIADYEEYSKKAVLEKGDILFSKSATIGKTAIVKRGGFMVWSPLAIIKAADDMDVKYLYYILSCSRYKEYVCLLATFNTQLNVGMRSLEKSKIAIAPLDEQRSIASFLDYKVGQIDTSVADINTQIEDLKAYRQSIISEAVTKGLNPDAPMKDSGIKWIGMIPERWNIIPMKYYFYMKGRIGWQGLKADEFLDEGPYLVTGTDFLNGRVCWDRCYHISEERYNEAPEIHVERGDLLITKDGTVGKLALIEEKPDKVSLNSHLLILRPIKNNVDNHFTYWALQSVIFKDYVGLASSGSTMASLSQEKIGSFLLALPPLAEQRAIADYLDKKTSKIDTAIKSLENQRDDLNALRQTVISEAVTGKIDLRDWKK